MADLLDTLTPRAILKDIVGKKMGELFWQKHPVWSAVQKNELGVKETVPGHYWWFTTVSLSNPQGHKILRETDQTFSAKYPHSKKHRTGFKLLTNSMKIFLSERMMKRADSNPEAVIKYSMDETARTMTSMFLELDATAHVGCSGMITQCSGAEVGASNVYVPVDDVNILDSMIGAQVKIYTSGASVTEKIGVTTAAYVGSVDYDNKRLYLVDASGTGLGSGDFAASAADGDWVMRYYTPTTEVTSADPETYPQQFGFPDVLSTSNIDPCDTTNKCLIGLDRDSYPGWRGQPLNLTDKPMNFHHFKQAIDLVDNRSMGSVKRILINTNTETEYIGQWYSRYNVNPPTMTVDGGFDAIKYTSAGQNVPIIVSKRVPDNEFWGIDTDSVSIKQLSDPYWREVEGQILIPSDTENVSYAMVLYDWNMVTTAPGQNVRAYGFTYSETG